MTNKTFVSAFILLLACSTCLAQSSYRGLTPGKSTKADVVRVLGQPVTEISKTFYEYESDKATEQIFVQYLRDSNVVARIELVYAATLERTGVMRALSLPPQPNASQINSKSKLEEYFSAASMVLTYAGPETTSSVSRVGYYSRELFESAAAKVPLTQPDASMQGGVPDRRQSGSSSTGLSQVPVPFPEVPGLSVSVDRNGRVVASASESGTPKTSKTAVTTRSAQGDASQRSSSKNAQIAVVTNGLEGAEQEIDMSAGGLRKFVGRYQFIQTAIPSLKAAIVELVGGKLKLSIGSSAYTLVATTSNEVDGDGQPRSDEFHFNVSDKPSLEVQFTMSRSGRVENLLYFEQQGEEMLFAVAVPKP